MRSESRFPLYVLAAFALHAAGAWTVRAVYTHPDARPVAPPAEVDILVEPAAVAVAPNAADEPRDPATTSPPANDDTKRARASSSAPDGRVGSVGNVVEAPPEPSPSPSDSAWSFSATGPTAPGATPSPAASARMAEAVREGIRATVAADEKRRDKLPTYHANDIAMGLAPGGQYVQQTRDAVRSSRAPSFGHATLEFQTNAAGLVVSVKVLEASSDRSAWDEIAAELVASKRARPERVPAGANGLAITLDVTSSMKTVSGAATNAGALEKIVGAINDPLDTIIDSRTPPQRIVAARVVDVQAF